MPLPEQRFRWTWRFTAPPEALWPLVSNTDRFNRDCGYPPVTALVSSSAHRRLKATALGLAIEWEEQAFEWEEPRRYSVRRVYSRGPVSQMFVQCELAPDGGGGTDLTYEMRLTPSSILGRLALPLAIGHYARNVTERVFRQYDISVRNGLRLSHGSQAPRLRPGGRTRLALAERKLVDEAHQPPALAKRLAEYVATADDLSSQRIRPYSLAQLWHSGRRETLQLLLHATRVGLLDFHWDILCPHCRGAQASYSTLGALVPNGHCPTCQIDFTANFDQSVELTFTPNPGIRSVPRTNYCVGGPQVTPHIVAQQALRPGESRPFLLTLKPGRYRVRSHQLPSPQTLRIEAGASRAAEMDLAEQHCTAKELSLAPGAALALVNSSDTPLVAIIEHVEWSDQATTAAEVTALQIFRDLFAREVLQPGSQISAGSLTVAFTDLKDSTQLYNDIGDAPAFGRVLTHFGILKAAVTAEGGAIVKTMGDAIMAVFPEPAAGLRALVRAQRHLARPSEFALPLGTVATHPPHPLALKAGLHYGACIAMNQNDRLDYFGTTVNLAARLCALGSGEDLVLSAAVRQDPEVAALLASHTDLLATEDVTTRLKGFGKEKFAVWRITAQAGKSGHPFWQNSPQSH